MIAFVNMCGVSRGAYGGSCGLVASFVPATIFPFTWRFGFQSNAFSTRDCVYHVQFKRYGTRTNFWRVNSGANEIFCGKFFDRRDLKFWLLSLLGPKANVHDFRDEFVKTSSSSTWRFFRVGKFRNWGSCSNTKLIFFFFDSDLAFNKSFLPWHQ